MHVSHHENKAGRQRKRSRRSKSTGGAHKTIHRSSPFLSSLLLPSLVYLSSLSSHPNTFPACFSIHTFIDKFTHTPSQCTRPCGPSAGLTPPPHVPHSLTRLLRPFHAPSSPSTPPHHAPHDHPSLFLHLLHPFTLTRTPAASLLPLPPPPPAPTAAMRAWAG